MRRAWKYKIYPTTTQEEALREHLSECCRLYNAAIQERRDAYKMAGRSISWYDQKRQLTEIRASGDIGVVNCSVGQHTLKRVDLAFAAFFRRCKELKKKPSLAKKRSVGFPKFRSRNFYDSMTYTWNNGCRFEGAKLYAQGIGNLKIRLDRPIQGKIKTLTIKREAHQWYAVFSCETEAELLPPVEKAIGVDVGLKFFAATSDGELIENPRFLKESEAKLRIAQRKLARRKRGSRGWKEAKTEIQRIHAKTSNQRREFHHRLSRQLVNENGLLAIENLNVNGMLQSRLAKSISDVAWSSFTFQLAYKSEAAGRTLVRVQAAGTSQTCICGASVPKTLSMRRHVCESCGADENRDVMSAKVILQRAKQQVEPPAAPCTASGDSLDCPQIL